MRLLNLLSVLAQLTLTWCAPTNDDAGLSIRKVIHTYNNNTIFQSPANYTTPGTLYARTITLSNGDLLATWENYSPEPPLVYFPIYKSTNHGKTWKELSRVTDTARGYGLRYQPFFYILPSAFGKFKAGDILLAGNSIPTNLSSTHIELYASQDNGSTWSFISHIANGGVAEPINGDTPVWEPFLLLYNNQLICYYSDQRDPSYGQKLVHQTSNDGLTWGPVINDVTNTPYTSRPGMTTVAQLIDKTWIMTYECGGCPVLNNNTNNTYSFPVYYRISPSPLTFSSAPAQPLISTDGTIPFSSPYVLTTPDGKVIVSSGTNSEVFVNHASNTTGVDSKMWKKVVTNERISYSRSLNLIDSSCLLIAGGGALPPSKGNRVTVGLVDISNW